jgi:general secretion pathway protein G
MTAMLIRTQRHERQGGLRRLAFTLMEVLIVTAIIVILAGLGGYYVMGQYKEAQVSEAKLKAKNIAKAVDTYYLDHNRYPDALDALLVKDDAGKGPYLTNQNEIVDPWGQRFQLDAGGPKNQQAGATVQIPDVFTTTPDGRMVGNWPEIKR